MKARKTIVRIVALAMAILMGLSVFAIFFRMFAADESTIAAIAQTGSRGNPSWFIYAALVAVLIIIVCVVVPKMTKKK